MLSLLTYLVMPLAAHAQEIDCNTMDYYGHFAFYGCGEAAADRMTQDYYGYLIDYGEVLVENDETDLGVSVHIVSGLEVTDMAVWLGDPGSAPADTADWTWTERDACLGDGMRIPLDLVDDCVDVTVQATAASYGADGSVIFQAVASAVVPYCVDTCGQPEAEPAECEAPAPGAYRTQTQGGWGTKAAGNNPGSYRDAHFDDAFEDGLVVGCEQHSLEFTSSTAVQQWLPQGGKPAPLTESAEDPDKKTGNVLAGQVVALGLSLGFDAADGDFGSAASELGGLALVDGPYAGWTVNEVYAHANDVVGGCAATDEASDVNDAVASINENFVDGSDDTGALECPVY